MIEGETVSNRICSAGLTLGFPEDQSAYRSKLFGLWGILASLKWLTEKFHIGKGTIVLACDGLLVLKKLLAPTQLTQAKHTMTSSVQSGNTTSHLNFTLNMLKATRIMAPLQPSRSLHGWTSIWIPKQKASFSHQALPNNSRTFHSKGGPVPLRIGGK